MKKIIKVLILFFIVLQLGCATMTGGLKVLPEPEPDTAMVFGAVLLENIDLEFTFSYFDLPLKVVLLGQDEIGKINHYTVSVSRDGYYCLPNVPKASYLLKAVIFQEPGEIPNIITNNWEYYDSKYYLMRHPERGIEYKTDWFPPAPKTRIINNHIKWFGLKSAVMQDKSLNKLGEIMFNDYDKDLKGERLWTEGHPYTRDEPLKYFKNKFPDSGWWQIEE